MTPLDQLRTTTETLSPKLRAEILALGEAAVPQLIAIVEEDDADADDAPGEGWPPIHAIELLVELRAAAAVETLLEVVFKTDLEDDLHVTAVRGLSELGAAAVLEPTLSRIAEAVDPDVTGSLLEVLTSLGVKDERIYDAIGKVFEKDPATGAGHFGQYGDPRALPRIREQLAALTLDIASPDLAVLTRSRSNLLDLLGAHQRLGGVLEGSLRRHVDSLNAAWNVHVTRQRAASAAPKVGRNDPCPCGSGKKYKKCCQDKMRGAAAAGDDADFLEFARPLLESTDGSKREADGALALAQLLWNIAITSDDDAREEMLTDFKKDIPPMERAEFDALARGMIDRYRLGRAD